MHKINVFISALIQNLVAVLIVGGILILLLGSIGKIITGILVIGSVIAAKDSITEKSIEEEIKGFDEALNETMRNMK